MTHTKTLREAAKFLAGLVAGDLLFGIWMLGSGLLPQTFLGAEVTAQSAWLWIGFDIFVLLVLVHYAWHPKSMEPDMSSRTLFFVVGVIMGVVAFVHFLRLVFGWPVEIGAWNAPMWLSGVGVVVAAFISYMSFHFSARRR